MSFSVLWNSSSSFFASFFAIVAFSYLVRRERLPGLMVREWTGTKQLPSHFHEFRLYHRKDGRVVKENDDLLCATRYGIMMLRHARTPEAYKNFHRKLEMPDLGPP